DDLRAARRRRAGDERAARARVAGRLDPRGAAAACSRAQTLVRGLLMAGVEPDELRRTMSRLVSGVSVVAARAGRHDIAATVSSLVSASLEPPVVLFTVHRDARLREAVEVGETWAVSILGEGGAV